MRAPSTPAGGDKRRPPAHARALAARLSALFDTDAGIVGQLNDAQRRLREANDRLWSGLAPDAFGLRCDGATHRCHSQIAQLLDTALSVGGPEAHAAWLRAVQDIHWQVHRAFCHYQQACEQRRQLAVEVGELSQQLTDTLCAAGWTAQEAQAANVHQLATGAWRTGGHGEPLR